VYVMTQKCSVSSVVGPCECVAAVLQCVAACTARIQSYCSFRDRQRRPKGQTKVCCVAECCSVLCSLVDIEVFRPRAVEIPTVRIYKAPQAFIKNK